MQCECLNKDGKTRCKNKIKKGRFCHIHMKKCESKSSSKISPKKNLKLFSSSSGRLKSSAIKSLPKMKNLSKNSSKKTMVDKKLQEMDFNDKIKHFIVKRWSHMSKEVQQKVEEDVIKRMNSSEYGKNPKSYMAKWEKARGNTEELRMPEDLSRDVMENMLK